MPEETWHQARLIPTSGITGADEQEGRGTPDPLSVMSAVKEFSRTLLAPPGAPSRRLRRLSGRATSPA